jgi:cytochrome P450
MRGETFFGSLREFTRDRLAFVHKAARIGPVVSFKLGQLLFHLISTPEDVKRVLVDNAANYSKETRGQDLLRVVLRDGLFTSDGELWKRQRRLIQPAFHKDRIASFAPVMIDATRELVDRWAPLAAAGTELDVGEEMMRLTLTIVGRTLLGVDLADSASEVGQALTYVLRDLSARTTSVLDYYLGTEIPTPKNVRMKRALAVLDRIVGGAIAERRKNPGERTDLLSILMRVRDDESGQGMPDSLLRDEVLTMVLAGHETTANALTWTFYLLSRHPEVERRVVQELATVLAGRAPTFEDVARLPYLRAVIDESMRLYPPVWMLSRAAIQDDVLSGYTIKAGSFVFPCPYVIHRQPNLWKNPEGFDPERFLNPDPERPRFAYFPFSGGSRQCIGNTFALLEAALILGGILPKYRLDLVAGHAVEPEPLMTLRPKNGMPMRLHRR